MQLNSLYFVLFFLPAALSGYYYLAKRNLSYADWFLILMSFVFYSFAGKEAFFMLLCSITFNYLAAMPFRNSRRALRGTTAGKAILGAAIAANAALLIRIKYTDFIAANVNRLFGTDLVFREWILPLGISFYTFSMISWLVDSYRGETDEVSLKDFVLYAVFFPKLTQGPILNIRRFRESRRTTEWDTARQAQAVCMFVLGMSKKLILANTFTKAVDWGFTYTEFASCTDMLLVMLAFAFEIYFDFSGYSDMAIAAGMMFGFDFPANFNSPYKAESFTDFWRRWHISLTTFFREYVYFPLGGSREGKLRTYRNILVVFLLSGLWHGASWSFALWGILHGLCQITERALGKVYQKVWKPVRRVITFSAGNILWLLFRSKDLTQFRQVCWHIFRYPFYDLNEQHLSNYRITGLRFVLNYLGFGYSDMHVFMLSAILFFTAGSFICFVPENLQKKNMKLNAGTLIFIVALSMICLTSMNNVSSFIYNHF